MEQWWAICAWCKQKVRRLDEDTWRHISSVDQKLIDEGKLSHGICPECEAKLKLTFNKNRPDDDSG